MQNFFSYGISEWNKPDVKTRKSQNPLSIINCLIKVGCPSLNSYYNIFNSMGLKLLTRLRLSLIHLNKYKFGRKLRNCFDPKCLYSLSNEHTLHFFLHYQHYTDIRKLLLNEISSINKAVTHLSDTKN